MVKIPTVSRQTRSNWLVDAALFFSAIIAALSGMYFLFLPTGGYQGGRNPWYGIQIIFSRSTWSDLHIWGGVLMIAVVAIHLPLHWPWVVTMTKRMLKELSGKAAPMNIRGRFNLILNLVVAVSFLLTALSGIYLLFFPGGHTAVDPVILFTRTTWDLIHTWAGVILIISAGVHFAIHWRWVTKVTTNLGRASIAGLANKNRSLRTAE
jgi:hypothetical protein